MIIDAMLRRLLRACHARVSFKRQILLALKEYWRPPEWVFRHLHFEGPFPVAYRGRSFTIFHSGTWIENRIFWEGLGTTWEPASLSLWSQLCKRAATIIDVGANAGMYSAVAAAMNPQARVVAFEPNANYAKGVAEMNRINGTNIELHLKALSASVGELAFDGYQVVLGSLEGVSRVSTTTLTQFIEQDGVDSVDLMKLDVEWHEPQVLRGMGEYLKRFHPSMLIEINGTDPEAGRIGAERIQPLIEGLDYRFFSIDDRRGTVTETPELRASDFWNVLICRPAEAERLEFPSGEHRHRT